LFLEVILKSLKETTREAFDRVVIVHNVGNLGSLKSVSELTDMNDWRTHYDLNLFIPAVLNAVVMNLFDDKTNTKKVVINITSLFGINAIVEGGHYCTVKAAREMYFKVIFCLIYLMQRMYFCYKLMHCLCYTGFCIGKS